jgi:hypothetical protein
LILILILILTLVLWLTSGKLLAQAGQQRVDAKASSVDSGRVERTLQNNTDPVNDPAEHLPTIRESSLSYWCRVDEHSVAKHGADATDHSADMRLIWRP